MARHLTFQRMRSASTASRAFRRRALIAAVAAALGAGSVHAAGIEAAPDEWEKLQACERKVCKMILAKKATEDVDCKATKTWEKKTIKDGEPAGVPTEEALKGGSDDSKSVKWGFGDAQCTARLQLPKSDLQAALTAPKHTMNIAPHTVKCLVDRYGEMKNITATLAPRIDFKNGQAHKIWINLKEMEGPSDIKGTVQSFAKLEDSLGIVHGPMIKSVNKWMSQKCDEKYGPVAEAKEKKKLEAEKAKAAKLAARDAKLKAKEARLKAQAAAAAKPADPAPVAASEPATPEPAPAATPPAEPAPQ